MDPQLSHYTQFFISLTNLTRSNQISPEQKQLLKTNLIKKDEALNRLLINNAGPGKELQLREALLTYLKSLNVNNRRRSYKSKTVHFQQEENEEIKDVPQQPLNSTAFVIMEQLSGVLQKHVEKFGPIVHGDERSRLVDLRVLIAKLLDEKIDIEGLSPLRARLSDSSKLAEISEKDLDSSDEDIYEKMLRNIKDIYRELKEIFTGNLHTHLLLMQEDISYETLYSVLKLLLKIVVDADEFTFFIRRENEWEVYRTANDSIKDMTPEEGQKVTDELQYIRQSTVHKISGKQYPQIEDLSKSQSYAQTSIIKFQLQMKSYEALFCFHWTDKDKRNMKRQFINQSNSYGFNKEVTHLAQFLVETIITAKVQFFNPLRFADQIQDIGISFMRISRFLLIEGIKRVLDCKFQCEKEQTSSTDEHAFKREGCVRIELKDTNPVTLYVKGMDLHLEQDKQLFQEIIRIQERYDGYVKLCYEKSAFYKYFLRTNDSLLFDFNKSGELIFLSRPISKQQKQILRNLRDRFGIKFDPKTVLYQKILYSEIFSQNSIISNIEVNIQNIHENRKNQYLSNQDSPQFEIFLKVVDNDFKGFSVIFHENEATRLKQQFKTLSVDMQKEANSNRSLEEDIQKQIQKSFNKHQTFKFLNQLDQTQDVGNSMIALFIPENELQQIVHRKSQSVLQNNDPESLCMIQEQTKGKQFKVEPLDYSIFKVKDEDSHLDEFGFNILEVESSQEKQRLVYAILERNGFILEYSMPLNNLASFLSVLQRKYNKRGNHFHNYDHGISVMQSTSYLCQAPKALAHIGMFRRMATVISALCHDVSHTARTNIFMINSQSKLATRYHDQSPLEQHHAATTISLLQDSSLNFLCNLSKEQYQLFRRILIDNILYTDIKVHFSLLKDFESRIPTFGTEDDMKLLTGMIVHTADFNGGAKVFELSRTWSEMVNREFSAQYAEEGHLGIPQTPFLKDLDKLHVIAKSEMGFFKVIVRPLWFTLNQFFDGYLQQSIVNLDNTIISWDKIYHANLHVEQESQQNK